MPQKTALPFGLAAAVLAASILFTVSCASPAPVVDPPAPAPNTVGEAAKQTLKNLPTIKMTLPKSLSATSSTAKSLTNFRALGDTTNLTTVPSLKSQAWYNLQGNGGNSFLSFINKAFDLLRTYAKANDIEDGTAFDLPVTDDNLVQLFGMPDNMRGQIKVATKILVSGAAVDEFSINVNVDIAMTMGTTSLNMTAHTRIDVSGTDTTQKLKMYFLVDETMKYGTTTYTMKIPMYASYDAATGACDMVQHNESGGSVYDSIQRTLVGIDGSITNVNVYKSPQSSSSNSVYAAYGDDVAGGIASLYSYSYTDYNNTTVNRDSYWGEYYGTDGNLLLRSNGDTNLWVPVWSGAPLINLKTAPFNFTTAPANPKQRTSWTSSFDSNTQIYTGSSTNEVLAADGATWVPVTRYNYTWDYSQATPTSSYTNEAYNFTTTTWEVTPNWGFTLVFKANTAANSAWTGGDTVYYQQDSESVSDGTNSYWLQNMYAGYVVPAGVNRFGKTYFVTNEYPLDAILPLKEPFASNYDLIQEEGQSNSWTWTDWDGNQQTSNWTNYSYYLNHRKTDENPIRMEATDGDINLNDKLSSYDMYYWHDGKSDKVKGYFLRTTGDVPPYFSQPSSILVNRVDSKLDQALTDANALSADSFKAELDICRNDPTKGVF